MMDLSKASDSWVMAKVEQGFRRLTGEEVPTTKGSKSKNAEGVTDAQVWEETAFMTMLSFLRSFEEAKRRGIITGATEVVCAEVHALIMKG